MKKFGQTIIILIIAVTVFLTGAGVTVIDYCCSSCGGQTLFMTEQHICCIEDQNTEAAQMASCCSMEKVSSKGDASENSSSTKDSHCTASRVSVDIDASSFRPHVVIPFIWVSDVPYVALVNTLFQRADSIDDFIDFRSPPDIPPREYLSLIRVLII